MPRDQTKTGLRCLELNEAKARAAFVCLLPDRPVMIHGPRQHNLVTNKPAALTKRRAGDGRREGVSESRALAPAPAAEPKYLSSLEPPSAGNRLSEILPSAITAEKTDEAI